MLNVPKIIDAATVAAMLDNTCEVALLDVREEGCFARGHMLLAVPVPMSQLEARLAALVPRQSAPVIITSDNDVLSHRAAERMIQLGYVDVAVFAGGDTAWQKAGYEITSGINVPSKAFGEYIESRYKTPHIDPNELSDRLARNEDILIFDSRPPEEFHNQNIPGATNCPGAELVYRVPEIVTSSDTLVVINCAGRTRSIVGCQSLINAGLPNKIVALRNGTMGWHLDGLPLEHGNTEIVPRPTQSGAMKARAMAHAVKERFNIKNASLDDISRFKSEIKKRTLYLFDVRSPDEYDAGHLPGSSSAPGGQLVQATDAYVGTRNARLVLIDHDGVRATMTASWLIQMGWTDVSTYIIQATDPLTKENPVQGYPAAIPASRSIDAHSLNAILKQGNTVVVDLAPSDIFANGHIPGAWFSMRPRLESSLKKLPPHQKLVLTSPNGITAGWAERDLHPPLQKNKREVLVLDGGNAAWRTAGYSSEAGFERALDPAEDIWHRPSSPLGGGESAMRQYIAWEVELYERVSAEPGLRFS